MKCLLTCLWGFVCLSVLVYGHIHWNKETAANAVATTQGVEQQESEESNEVTFDQYLALAANWPETAKQSFKQALESEQPFKILFVGTTANQWEAEVTQRLTESYGSEHITTAIHTYDQTSKDIVSENKQLELAAEKAQLVVIEPFLLNDNGKVKIDGTLANLTKIIEDVKLSNPDTAFIIQPSYPIYLPKYYSTQVEALKAYAEENNLTYLDHWTAWPATDNPEIKNYLNEDQSSPNENGYQAWGQFLVQYFVNK
ncbi:SGNH/GDSL hydrolase family protein [Neobacillus sp. DY30]|uniref:SGNH/GDSL hydrolase family protein n=1 Tax=Neobacillus sp. DY30 TaxID=3047871 RepID=UPI0024BF6251|nr:SGNH/GDSL hydrolase family protein [Neobacillus sp. DY30]WHY00431.1 SGNH/GDSL hydrolase family protein [Neobacillus sp. DY30]